MDWESYFGNNEPKYHVTIKPFYGAADLLVVQDNACGPFPGCEQAVDGENHVMIVKPSDTNHSAYTKLRVQVDSMTGMIPDSTLVKRSPPSSKEEKKLHPITTTMTPDDLAALAITCGPSPLTLRTPEEFFPEWEERVEKFRHRNEQFQDLEYLTESNIPRAAPLHPVQWHHEATYTLRCLAKKNKLRIEQFNPPRKYRGEFENLKIVFPE